MTTIVLSAAELKTVRLALHLAISYESSLADGYALEGLRAAERRKLRLVIEQCERNVAAFQQLRARL